MPHHGFSSAELAAAEWSRLWKEKLGSDRRSEQRRRKGEEEESSSSATNYQRRSHRRDYDVGDSRHRTHDDWHEDDDNHDDYSKSRRDHLDTLKRKSRHKDTYHKHGEEKEDDSGDPQDLAYTRRHRTWKEDCDDKKYKQRRRHDQNWGLSEDHDKGEQHSRPSSYSKEDRLQRDISPKSKVSRVKEDTKHEPETSRTKRVAKLLAEIKAEEAMRGKPSRGDDEASEEEDETGGEDDAPPDPRNPLFAAYERPLHRRLAGRRMRRQRESDGEAEAWTHDRFRNRSLSPQRPCNTDNAPTYDTRAGSWRARAGGVYLPPEEEEEGLEEGASKDVEERSANGGRRRYWD